MKHGLTTRFQVALVILLFLGSLSALVFNVISIVRWSSPDEGVRLRLRDASRRLIEGSSPLSEELAQGTIEQGALDKRLRQLSAQVLLQAAGIEGGFYLCDEDQFAGYGFPTSPHGPKRPSGSDPPPLEAPYIRVQARQSADLNSGEFLFAARDVGPSRVAFLSEPVGDRRPAALVVWVMMRLTGPETIESKANRYALSSVLALLSVLAALLLSWNLGRTLRRQRKDEERLRDELRRSEHLASLGRLLAGVAHEVRNPLAGIRSTVQLWQRLPDQARTNDSMNAVVGAVDRLNELVARLLLFSRADGNERQPVSLNQLAQESLALLEAQASAQGVRLERNFAEDLPQVAGAANALRQVMLNLFTNAMQAMPQGGAIRCRAQCNRKGMVEFRVEDSGHGVSESDRPHLFEPFFTTRSEGTGLGLALCREIIVGHGGAIELESTGPDGACFLIVLPALS